MPRHFQTVIFTPLSHRCPQAHGCRSAEGREHFEFALALLRESWIAESGQRARTAAQVIGDVQQGLRMIAAIIQRKGEQA